MLRGRGGVADTLLLAVWWFRPQNHRWTVFRLEAQNLSAVLTGIGGNMWHHREACVEAKLSHEGRVAIGCFCLKLDHYVPWVKWFSKISKRIVRIM
jgi:hypothetical protein